ncbi:MAG TPA: SRPBCC domain-containing protein [Kofleriaceae bacterium]|nr:SRPBCC domain-containing protein [Kofleriaceae bacterium]
MNDHDYTVEIVIDATPEAAFRAINHVRGWWSGEVAGETDRLGAEFSYRVPGIHDSKQRITKLVPGATVEWLVIESDLAHAQPRTEWTGTRIRFDLEPAGSRTRLRFTHMGLRSELACYDSCSGAWALLLRGNLRRLVESGEDQPDAFAS